MWPLKDPYAVPTFNEEVEARRVRPLANKCTRYTGRQDAGFGSTSIGNGDPDGEAFEEACQIVDLASSIMGESKKNLPLSSLETAITSYRQLLEVTSDVHDHPVRRQIIPELASALAAKFLHAGEQAYFAELEEIAREILECTKPPHSQLIHDEIESQTGKIEKTAHNELQNFHKAFSLSTTNTAIYLLQQCIDNLPASHMKRHHGLAMLAYSFYIRYHHTADVSDLIDAASALWNNAQTEVDSQNNHVALQHLLAICATRLDDIEMFANFRAVYSELSKKESKSMPPVESDDDFNYGASLCRVFQRSGNVDQLEEGIKQLRRAIVSVPSTHSFYPLILNNLAAALTERFGHCRHDVDLDEAIRLAQQALNLTDPHHPEILQNLSAMLVLRLEDGNGEAQDLEDAISFRFEALDLIDPFDPVRPDYLSLIAGAFKSRYELGHDARDLDTSILFYRQAFESFSPHTNSPYILSNFANALATRFQHSRDISDLDEAIQLQTKALDSILPHDPKRWRALTVLGGIFQDKFEKSNPPDAQDLDHTISIYKQALSYGPPHCFNYYALLKNIVRALERRFRQGRKNCDIEDCISTQNLLVEFFPPNHPGRYNAVYDLANLHILAYQISSNPEYKQKHLEEAMSDFSMATVATSQAPSRRLLMAKTWAQCADEFKHPTAKEAYEIALGILPHVAGLAYNIQSRQSALTSGEIDGISRRAARYAIQEGQLGKAIEYLEMGRGIFWSQALRLRSPSGQLCEVAPNLERNLQRISTLLEESSYIRVTSNVDQEAGQVLVEEATQVEKLAKEWSEAIQEVRKLDGFEDFLQPKRLSALQSAAEGGPIIYLIANNDSSDCLVMTVDAVHHIPLPFLPAGTLFSFFKDIENAASGNGTSSCGQVGMLENQYIGIFPRRGFHDFEETHPSSIEVSVSLDEDQDFMPAFLSAFMLAHERALQVESAKQKSERSIRPTNDEASTRAAKQAKTKHKSADDTFRGVLSSLWDSGVKPIIEFLGLEKRKEHTTVKWCPTGLFAFLPIHAAGCYDEGKVDCASDYLISSYTPNAETLLTDYALPPSEQPLKMMAVIQSQNLPSTEKELENIEQHVNATSSQLIKFGVKEAPSSVEEVASCLPQASIVHFACHGKQNKRDPLKSGLEIEGERLTISRIMKEKIPSGALAFLSACETAARDERMPDEDMSIGASLLFAGFRSVVATMWKMEDSDGPIIADAFYEELCKGPDGNPLQYPNPNKSARALAMAVDKLRMRGVPFKRWVPFIHIGK